MSSGAPRASVVAAATLLGGLLLGVAVLGGSLSDSGSSAALASLALSSEACTLIGPVTGLTPDQAQNAEIIVATTFADTEESPRAAQIALMVAYTESGLHDLGPMPGNDGSLGLYQQRVSQGWGTASEEMDPPEATAMFVERLLELRSWQTRTPWTAAQAVQRSANRAGTNYETHWSLAGQILADSLTNGNSEGGCGQGVSGGLAGSSTAHGLPAGYTIPAGTPPGHAQAVTFALAQLGKRYLWGGAGPDAFDCSGLTMQAWATVGVRLQHYTVDQLHEGQLSSTLTMTAGDLVLVPGSDAPGPGLPGHVGIYLGDSLVLSAIDPQMGIAVQTWQTFVSGGLDGVVDPAPGI